jgi:cobalt-precorrin-5B (C1)-methyltransferase
MDINELRRGYTTGVHASFVFARALESYLSTSTASYSTTNKMDNDDIDVTKGCEIVAIVSDSLEDLTLNTIEHRPYTIGYDDISIEIYAGVGVGVVTKDGLKPPKGYPAINPTPLKAIEDIYISQGGKIGRDLYCSISVVDGEEIAKKSANPKVGVLGGISILGTTGFVKPISNEAYLDSIYTEISFIKANGYDRVVLTLGDSSFKYASDIYPQEQIVEIGNFVYDTIEMSRGVGIYSIVFIAGIGKMTKVYQGFKNSHNRYGMVDLDTLKGDIYRDIGIKIDIEESRTVKYVADQLDKKGRYLELCSMLELGAKEQISKWFTDIDIEPIINSTQTN